MNGRCNRLEREPDGLWRVSLWFEHEPVARLVLALIDKELVACGFVAQELDDNTLYAVAPDVPHSETRPAPAVAPHAHHK